MAVEHGQPQETDLDKTDRLPILEGVPFDEDVADDAVRMERSAPGPALLSGGAQSDFVRPSPVDLPSLTESLRTVEERIARQNAEYEALTRSYERARDAESAAIERAGTLAEAAARESERHETEARSLRDSLAAREATIVQVLHSLGERDAQLSALQSEHAKVLPALEARAKSGTQLEDELAAVRAQLGSVLAQLKSSQYQTDALGAQAKRHESDINAARADLASTKTQARSYFELLRTRDWRSHFHQNLFLDMDGRIGAADAARAALQAERDRIAARLAAHEATIAAHSATIDQLRSAATAQTGSVAEQAQRLEEAERQRAEWTAKLSALEADRTHLRAELEADRARLRAELAARDRALSEAQANVDLGKQHIAQMQSEHGAKIAQLEAEAETQEQEMTVLMAHLQEARRPIESVEGDLKRVKEELALKTKAISDLTEEGDKLRAALERTRGQLEEREFLIRRLERSENNNANVLGRIQTSMERLGSSVTPGASGSAAPEWSPELIRIDGDRSSSHTLGRRTRIGRAPGCELYIDSSSVSRHHALILAGTREAIIEDLNSTNGVIVNGRKVTRQVLSDGDILTIGEIQFRYVAKPLQPPGKG
jgi:chromosome segregation ATPase